MPTGKSLALAVITLAVSTFAIPGVAFAQAYSSPVKITNVPAQPVPNRDTDQPARSPFRKNWQLSIQGTDRAGDVLTVPQGFRLVIETFTAKVQVPVGERVLIEFTSTVTSNGTPLVSTTYIPVLPQGTFSGADIFVANQPMKIYVDPTGNTLSLLVFKTTSNGSAFADVSISGYLVPIP
jgi:hypothetical protein